MLFNAILFNILWFGLILYGNLFIPVAVVGLCVHFYRVDDLAFEAWLVLIVSLIGLSVDVLLTFSGVFLFSDIPYWLLFVWLAFASTINHSLKWVASIPYATHFIGLFIAPLSYLAAERFEAVAFGYPTLTTYLLIGFVWLVLFNVFVHTRVRWLPTFIVR